MQLSLQAVQVDGRFTVTEQFGIAPETPLFEAPAGNGLSDVADRLIEIFGTSAVTASLEAQQIELDLATTVFATQGSGEADDIVESDDDDSDPEGGISVVA